MTGAFPNRAQRMVAARKRAAVLLSVCDAINAMPPAYVSRWEIVSRTGTPTGRTSGDYWDLDRICARLNDHDDAARPYRIERTNPSTQEATT